MMRFDTRVNYFLFGIFVASIILPFLDGIVSLSLSIGLFIYLTVVISLYFKKRKDKKNIKLNIKKTKEHKALLKIKKQHENEKLHKHDNINNQIAYIQDIWELSKHQQKTFKDFVEKRAYSDLYTKMTNSLLPQLIKMIEICIDQNKNGCKREVTKRINELVKIMKTEISKTKSQTKDHFETTSEVYDKLIGEIK